MISYCVVLLQESIKCMRHAKRTILTADDVDSALSLRNVEVNHLPWIKFQHNSNVGEVNYVLHAIYC
jgi:hypothetical protein